MTFPARLLHDEEVVIVDTGPHPVRLLGPFVRAAVVLAGLAAGLVLWRDAPSWFGIVVAVLALSALLYVAGKTLAFRATRFVLTSQRVIFRYGVIRRVGREIPLGSIQDVTFHQGLVERIVGAGHLTIDSAGERGAEAIGDVAHPEVLQGLINRQIQVLRRPVVMTAGPRDDDVVSQVERLAELHRRGVITASEFATKRADLLDRL
jgi:membrane protein YdbS with pleckstrin-like domain